VPFEFSLRETNPKETYCMKVQYGYIGKMLFVDLTHGKTHEEDLSEELAKDYIGGYGIGVRVLLERMKPGVDPLGPDNILGIGTGPLTATGGLSSCRYSTMGKSPLTGYWGDANSGGNFANALRAAGFDMVFSTGKADHPVYLLIQDGKPEIKDARHLWGKDSSKTEELIRQDNGSPTLKVSCIGMAGEKLSRIAAIMNDRGRAAARSGLGAVMGSKNLKAVACEGSRKPKVYDRTGAERLMRTMMQQVKETPHPMYQVLNACGTPGSMVSCLATHDAPIKNWGGNNVEDFPKEKWEKISWDGMAKYVRKKYACTGCRVACGGILDVPNQEYPAKAAHKPEYETLAAFGSNCLNDNMESIIYANELCNLHGLDTISAGGVIAFAIECYENGILTNSDTDGLELTWGNSRAIVQLLEKICKREGIGDLLAEGAKIAAAKIGNGAEKFAMHVGGELVPMHDPRCKPGVGATYIADPTPARHTRGGTTLVEAGMADPEFMKALGIPSKFEPHNPEGKGKAHAILAGWMHVVNTSGLCLLGADALSFPMVEMLNAITNWGVTLEDLVKTGQRIATLQHAFNLREGFKPSDFTMPPRIEGKPAFKAGSLKDVTLDLEGLKKQYYEAMKFDYTTGKIQKERIAELGLEHILS
jgi:aldehyde:ferredoxin oxidoreductase